MTEILIKMSQNVLKTMIQSGKVRKTHRKSNILDILKRRYSRKENITSFPRTDLKYIVSISTSYCTLETLFGLFANYSEITNLSLENYLWQWKPGRQNNVVGQLFTLVLSLSIVIIYSRKSLSMKVYLKKKRVLICCIFDCYLL